MKELFRPKPMAAIIIAGCISFFAWFIAAFGLGTNYDCPEQAGTTTCNVLNTNIFAYTIALIIFCLLIGWLVARKGRRGWILLALSPVILFASTFIVYFSSAFFIDRAQASQEQAESAKVIKTLEKINFDVYLPKYLPPNHFISAIGLDNNELQIFWRDKTNYIYPLPSGDVASNAIYISPRAQSNSAFTCPEEVVLDVRISGSCQKVGENEGTDIYLLRHQYGARIYYIQKPTVSIKLISLNETISDADLLKVAKSLEEVPLSAFLTEANKTDLWPAAELSDYYCNYRVSDPYCLNALKAHEELQQQ